MVSYVVSESFVDEHQGRRDDKGNNGLYFRQDIHGRWLINVSVADFWPDIDFSAFPIVTVTIEDFPHPEDI